MIMIAYGYRRRKQDFAAYEIAHYWFDKEPERLELADLMGAGGKHPGVEPGEVLLLLHHADIGDDWRQRRRVLVWLADRGVMVKVRDQDAVLYDTDEKLAVYKSLNGGDRTQKDPGRPMKIKWTIEKAKEFGAFWYGPYSKSHVVRQFEEITKRKFNEAAESHVKYFFGPRSGSRKKRYNQFIEEAD